jgi:uncharacterized damage-inducible protein DinB
MNQTGTPPDPPDLDQERADILETLQTQRDFLRYTVRDLSDEQASRRTTASELCLGGLIKHVAAVEAGWARFVLEGPAAMAGFDQARHGRPGRRLPHASRGDPGGAPGRL